MNLLDNHFVTGDGEEEFFQYIDEQIHDTNVCKIHNVNMTILSFKRKTQDGKYVFFEINEETLNALNNGVYKEFPLKVFVPKSDVERDLFEETRIYTGMMILYQGYVFFLSRGALGQLPEKAGIRGPHVLCKSFARDLFIADGLFNPTKRLGEDAMSILVYRTTEINGIKIRKIFAVMGKKYVPSSLKGVKNIVMDLLKRKSFGKAKIVGWRFTQDYTTVRIEFPEYADKIASKANVTLPNGDRMIPGLMITDSDSGKSSLAIAPTYRMEGQDSFVTLESKMWEHVTELKVKEVWDYINNIWPYRMIETITALSNKNNIPMKGGVKNVYLNWSKELQLVGAIGKGKEMIVKEKFLENFDVEDENFTEYDVVKFFMSLPGQIEMPLYASNKLIAACGKAPFTAFRDVVLEWKD